MGDFWVVLDVEGLNREKIFTPYTLSRKFALLCPPTRESYKITPHELAEFAPVFGLWPLVHRVAL
jgi:hypothetical protein